MATLRNYTNYTILSVAGAGWKKQVVTLPSLGEMWPVLIFFYLSIWEVQSGFRIVNLNHHHPSRGPLELQSCSGVYWLCEVVKPRVQFSEVPMHHLALD